MEGRYSCARSENKTCKDKSEEQDPELVSVSVCTVLVPVEYVGQCPLKVFRVDSSREGPKRTSKERIRPEVDRKVK